IRVCAPGLFCCAGRAYIPVGAFARPSVGRVSSTCGPALAGYPARSLSGARSDSAQPRSEEHTSELQSLMRISYAVFCLKKKTKQLNSQTTQITTLYNEP